MIPARPSWERSRHTLMCVVILTQICICVHLHLILSVLLCHCMSGLYIPIVSCQDRFEKRSAQRLGSIYIPGRQYYQYTQHVY